jgi:hypothetical protein
LRADFTSEVFLSPEPVIRKLLELSPKSSLGSLARGVHAWKTDNNSSEAVRKAV